jgi:hypothetical protein
LILQGSSLPKADELLALLKKLQNEQPDFFAQIKKLIQTGNDLFTLVEYISVANDKLMILENLESFLNINIFSDNANKSCENLKHLFELVPGENETAKLPVLEFIKKDNTFKKFIQNIDNKSRGRVLDIIEANFPRPRTSDITEALKSAFNSGNGKDFFTEPAISNNQSAFWSGSKTIASMLLVPSGAGIAAGIAFLIAEVLPFAAIFCSLGIFLSIPAIILAIMAIDTQSEHVFHSEV